MCLTMANSLEVFSLDEPKEVVALMLSISVATSVVCLVVIWFLKYAAPSEFLPRCGWSSGGSSALPLANAAMEKRVEALESLVNQMHVQLQALQLNSHPQSLVPDPFTSPRPSTTLDAASRGSLTPRGILRSSQPSY